MSCATCGRAGAAGQCVDGYIGYLSGEYPCPFNPDPLALPRNLVELAPLSSRAGRIAPAKPADTPNVPEREGSSDGLEDLL